MSIREELKRAVLHVASPRECNTQQMQPETQQGLQQAMQQTPSTPDNCGVGRATRDATTVQQNVLHSSNFSPRFCCTASAAETGPTAVSGFSNISNGSTASRCWRVRYSGGRTVEIAYCPAATRGQVVACHPDAEAVEPFVPVVRKPAAPMTPREETAVRAWLGFIGESDPTMIADVITQCEEDADARIYFTGRKV